ncbi:DUF1858 domain-containing protein [Azospirillum sp. ST 5-10]|uniref:DUF1858 domain-containing protein n=1 Tax=unclassified Azospirillum TaxID=2630922 RepID=UPI003F4A246B
MTADTPSRLRPDQTVAELLDACPPLAAVFLHRRMACPGCAMAPFMTVGEAADSYGLDPAVLMAELEAARAGRPPDGPFAPPLPHGAAAG